MLVAATAGQRVEGRTAVADSPPAKGRMTDVLPPLVGRHTVTVPLPFLSAGRRTLATPDYTDDEVLLLKVVRPRLRLLPSLPATSTVDPTMGQSSHNGLGCFDSDGLSGWCQ